MPGKLAFGRRKHDEKPTKVAKREEGEKTCRAGACAYAAVLEASTFRAEATRTRNAKPKLRAGSLASSDLNTSLYDSFELDSFSSQLGHCLAEERRHAHVAHDLVSSWRPPRSHVAPRCHSRRRLSISCCPLTFPSCFPKRTPTIQLGKRKKPSLNAALHVIAKVARRGCHVIAALPACTTGNVMKQPQKLQQTHHHYHHHLHHYTLERPRDQAQSKCNDRGRDVDHNDHRYGAHVNEHICDGDNDNRGSEHLHPHLPTTFLSPHTLAYLPLEELVDPHLTSIKYHS